VAPRNIRRGQAYALAAIAIWSTSFIVGRMLRNDVTPATISSVRALVSGVPLAVWVVVTRQWPKSGRRALPGLVWVGLIGIFGTQYLTYLALHWSLATNAIILNAASPIVTASLAVVTGMSTFSRGLFGGLAISAAGAAVVTMFGASGGAAIELDPGSLLIIGSIILWAIYNLAVQRLTALLPPIAITAGAMLAGLPFLLVALALEHPPHLAATVRSHLPLLLYLAVGPSAIAYICWAAAVRDLGADYAMLYNNVTPIFGMILGGLILHERISIVQVMASALIIGGILFAFRSLVLRMPVADLAGSPAPGSAPLRDRARPKSR
jgi:drug/metabolite transporter (DMT)-like permease